LGSAVGVPALIKWRVWVGVRVKVRPEWQEELRPNLKQYYTDRKHPAWMSPQYAEDIFLRFIHKDWERMRETLRAWGTLKEHGITVKRGR
jgi:hypothetical protein